MSPEQLPQPLKNNEKNTNPLVKKIALGALVASSLTSYAKDTPETVVDETMGKEIDYEANTLIDSSETANPFDVSTENKGLYESVDPTKEIIEKKPNTENSEIYFSIDVTKSFGFEKAKLTPQQFQEAETEIITQLQSLPPETLKKLEQGEKVIVVKVSRSPEEIIKGGYDAGRGWVHNNQELAKDTAEEGGDVIESAIQKIGIPKVTLQFEIPEGGVDKDNPTRYVKISFEDVIKEETISQTEINNNPEHERLLDSYAVIVDKSPSMNSEAVQVQKVIHDINQALNTDILVVKLEAGTGGATEKHMLTLNRVLDGVKEPFKEKKYIYVYTDEPDFDSSKPYLADGKYEMKLQETIERAQSLNLEIRLKAFQPGNTMKSIDKTLESGDLTMQSKQSEIDTKWFNHLDNSDALASLD